MLICSWFIWMPVLLSVCPLKVRLFPPLRQLSRALMQRHVRFASPPPPTSRNSSTAASSLALKPVNSTAATSFKDALLSQKNPRINQSSNPSYQSFRQNKKLNMLNRCFRCLGLDHHVKDCRDPLICASCRRSGHRQDSCKTSMASNPTPRRSTSSPNPTSASSVARFTTRWVR